MTSLAEHPHTAAFADLRWDPALPAFYAPHNVWAYSLKKAVDRIERTDLRPNLARVYAVSLLRHRRQRAKILAARSSSASPWLAITWEIARELVFQTRRYAIRLTAPKAGGTAIRFDDLPDISAAYDRLEQYIADRGIVLKLPDCASAREPAPGTIRNEQPRSLAAAR